MFSLFFLSFGQQLFRTLILLYLPSESKELVSTLKGHSSAIHQISAHGSGRYAISSSHDISILWELDTFTRKRTLNGAQAVGVQQVCSSGFLF